MPLRKLGDLHNHQTCRHPDHDPPTMIVLPDGIYEHTCPGCGQKTTFTIQRATWCVKNGGNQGTWSCRGDRGGTIHFRHI